MTSQELVQSAADRRLALRNLLIGGVGASALTLLVSVYLYPPLAGRLTATIPLLAICGSFTCYGYAAWFRTEPSTAEDTWVLERGLTWGLILGVLWAVQIVFENIVMPRSLGAPVAVLLAVLALALPLAIGAIGAIQGGKIRLGIRVGFWSGLVSGLFAFFGLAIVGYVMAFVPWLPGAEFPKAAQFTTQEFRFLNVTDGLGGAISHLVLGILWGVVAGIMGGTAATVVERSGR